MRGFFHFWVKLVIWAVVIWSLAFLLHFPCKYKIAEEVFTTNPLEDWSLQLQGIDHLLQISDIHLDPKLEENSKKLSFFRNHVVPVIVPKAVLVTGDLTNGKKDTTNNWFYLFLGHPSSKRLDEWNEYYVQTQEYRHKNASVLWSDVRGNHDSFGVDDMIQDDDLFQRYAVEPQPKNAVSFHRFSEQNDIKLVKYSPYYRYSLHRPFHFFARTNNEELQLLMQASLAEKKEQVVIVYGHFPSSTIDYTVSETFWRTFLRFFWWSRSILSRKFYSYPNYVIYLSGHLHSVLGFLPRMYCKCGNYMELELADLYTSSVYRWIVIDHGNFAFSDIPIQQNIFAVVTNPVPLSSSTKRSQAFALSSKYIRLMVASLESFWDRNLTLGNVEVFIDDKKIGIAKKMENDMLKSSSGSNLFLCAWNPMSYLEGFHNLVVQYCFEESCMTMISTSFSLQSEQRYHYSCKDWIRCLMLFADAPVVIKGLCLIGLLLYGILVHIPYFSTGSCWLPSSWIVFGKRLSFVRKTRWRVSQVMTITTVQDTCFSFIHLYVVKYKRVIWKCTICCYNSYGLLVFHQYA
ncbi:Histone acetyltransferase type B catalytic subunit [Galdieria sulphuraria]|nr:Histone acetyltransferase type B catalytic subunit [Galdieria sulphuraria]